MSEPQAPAETAGNALRALQGQSLEVNTPFEQVGRLAEAIKDGGGGGGGYDDSELRRRIEALEKPQTFIATYQQTTAQDIVAFLRNNPHAPIVVQNGDDVYSSIFSKILTDNKVMLRTIASLQGKFKLLCGTVLSFVKKQIFYFFNTIWMFLNARKEFVKLFFIQNIGSIDSAH